MKEYIFKDIIPNIEVEDKETIQLPNGETYKITGKSHAEGGEKVFAPNNTLVFSHKLKADKKLVEEITGKPSKKKISFANLSKKYDTTKYSDIVQSPLDSYDELSRKTAELMFSKNNAQQENIFFAQEALKASKGMNNVADSLQQKLVDKIEKYQRGGRFSFGLNRQAIDPRYSDQLINFNAGNLSEGLQSRVRGDLFGDISGYNPEHVKWFESYSKEPFNAANFQKLHRKATTQKNLPPYDFDDAAGLNIDNKYGNTTYHAYLFQKTAPGRVPTSINVHDYKNMSPKDRMSFAKNQGIPLNEMDEYFNDFTHQLNLQPREGFFVNPIRQANIGELSQVASNRQPQTVTSDSDFNYYAEPELTQDEVPYNISPEEISDSLKIGMGLFELASLSKENPYYSNFTEKPVQTRYRRIDTLPNERAASVASRNILNSNLPQSVKASYLARINADLQDNITNISVQDNANYLNNANQNTANIINAYNRNTATRENANMRYIQEAARGQELFDRTRIGLYDRLFNLYDEINYRNYSRDLMSQLSNNFVNNNGNIEFRQGSTPALVLQQLLDEYK